MVCSGDRIDQIVAAHLQEAAIVKTILANEVAPVELIGFTQRESRWDSLPCRPA
jgi:hypothetical protein